MRYGRTKKRKPIGSKRKRGNIFKAEETENEAKAKDKMAIQSTEYDLESFLDEYKPLCCDYKPKVKVDRLTEFRKNWMSELPLTNHPLSYLRREKRSDNTKQKKSQQNGSHLLLEADVNIKTVVNETTFKRRDSGYSSHCSSIQQEVQDKNNKQHHRKENIMHTTNIDVQKQSTLDKKTKPLNDGNKKKPFKIQNFKKKHSKQNVNKESVKDTTNSNKKSTVWKKAKTHAIKIKSRFVRQEVKATEDELVLNSPLIINTPKPISTKHMQLIADKKVVSRQNSFTRNSCGRNSYTGKRRATELKLQFEDNFTLPRMNRSSNNYCRSTLRKRPKSLAINYSPNISLAVPEETNRNSGIFDEKYLNQSRSQENVFENEEEESVIDVFLDDTDNNNTFLDDTDINDTHEFSNNLFDRFDLDHEENDNEDTLNDENDSFYNEIVQNEVENYYDASDETTEYIHKTASFSYSVNNLYDFYNKEKTIITQHKYSKEMF